MIESLIQQTRNTFVTHHDLRNLTMGLTWQDGNTAIWNGALGLAAGGTGYVVAALVRRPLQRIEGQTKHTSDKIIDFVARYLGSLVGAAAGFQVASCLPLPTRITADKAIRLDLLAILVSIFLRHPARITPFQLPIALGGTIGCFPASSLFVCGGVGAYYGAWH